ncbi:PD-(D/E)XK motif protein [Halomonas sp. JS92-SW72]|uniref:PD-(D/E)XK motif protein n=1 Tax=Halomonas sp. JS92-SW72 TaxID=2306583 RepID=UPI000E5A1C43|nr:PD-(D/E)XK motif protein [Halomonas sp. JS92-SW72]AXY41904.1 PD-(D/E)XK motif protein [Halomonas sp. JS92-SW72]
MARPSEEFLIAWSSLTGHDPAPGWQAISLPSAGPVKVKAGRRTPTNLETVLLFFPSAKIPRSEKLPEGKGFLVERIESINATGLWLALTRKAAGSPELFAAMACDAVGAIDNAAATGVAESKLPQAFIRRVIAWQQFMSRGATPLGAEAELGLVGELTFIVYLLQAGVPTETVLEGWVGPEDAPQDFVIGLGSIEVKTTLSTAGFVAKISSLEQLDDSTYSPLFLAALRFSREETGLSLPELVSDLEHRLAEVPGAVSFFHEKLLTAGYVKTHETAYTRRFQMRELLFHRIIDGFPRLTRSMMPDGVFRAVYEIELHSAGEYIFPFDAALKSLGVLK